jgi:prolyl 4-hydroxylase
MRTIIFLPLHVVAVCLCVVIVNTNAVSLDAWARALDRYENGQMLSLNPPIAVVDNFLTAKECDYLVSVSLPHLVPAKTAGDQTISKRTSSSHFLTEHQANRRAVRKIRKRIRDLLLALPLQGHTYALNKDQQFEALQIQRYGKKQLYQPHYDYSAAIQSSANFRFATVLMYLSTPEEGGETIFPLVEKRLEPGVAVPYNSSGDLKKQSCRDEILCDASNYSHYRDMPHCCCSETLKVRPAKGRALLFLPRLANGESDKRTWHGGCPIVKGEKFTAQQWVHSPEIAKMVPKAPKGMYGIIETEKPKRKRRKPTKKRKGNVEL